jgi:hypothetical protein
MSMSDRSRLESILICKTVAHESESSPLMRLLVYHSNGSSQSCYYWKEYEEKEGEDPVSQASLSYRLICLVSILANLSSRSLTCITDGPSAVSLNNASLHSFANLGAANL